MDLIETQNSYKNSSSCCIFILLGIVSTLSILCGLLKYSNYGIDFTDEGFYLNWISNPFLYNISLTQFGFIYHPLYMLLNGDIAALRQVNVLLTFSLAWLLIYTFLVLLEPGIKKNRFALHAIASGLATSVFVYFDTWLPTPSYNSLALQSLLITSTGLLLAEKKLFCRSIIGWVVIGVGGWLAFMSKPSTALAIASAASIYIIISKKLSFRLILLSVITAVVLLVASSLFIDGSLPASVQRIRLGIELGKYLGGGHTFFQILRVDDFQLGEDDKRLIVFLLAVSLVAMCATWWKEKIGLAFSMFLYLSLFLFVVLISVGVVPSLAMIGGYHVLLFSFVIFATVIFCSICGRIFIFREIPISHWAATCLFLVMPHIYAFGSNGNYWKVGGAASIFWVLAGLTFLGPLLRRKNNLQFVFPLVIVSQVVTVMCLQIGFNAPYRQIQPLRLNESSLTVGREGSTLILSNGYAEYIRTAVEEANKAGFKRTTPVIDLTGQSPGILYALGAQSLGQAWLIGGYPGSLDRAIAALNYVSCSSIASAWILSEPNGPRSIPFELLTSVGVDLAGEYELAGTWYSAAGAGGYSEGQTQILYMPKNSAKILDSCRATRNE